LGIVPLREALELSEQKQLDLVEIAPSAKPPVCRLMDYGKFKFELLFPGSSLSGFGA
jgi:translation initiation factor IF-3